MWRSIFRRSGHRFAAENATNARNLERIPIPSNRNALWRTARQVRKAFRLRAFTPTEGLLANGEARLGVAADTFASSESDIECPYRR
jgi:hypothetical protein